MGLDSQIDTLLKLSGEADSLKEEGAKNLREIQEKIKKGESTGDPIKDFLIICYDTIQDVRIEKNLNRLKEEIANHQNEQVLVTRRYVEKTHEVDGVIPCAFYGLNETLNLGILNGELNFDLDKKRILIPTPNYAERYSERAVQTTLEGRVGKWNLHDGEISVLGWDFPVQEEFDKLESLYTSGLRILIRDRDAELYFRFPEHHFWNFLKEIKEGKINDKKLAILLKEFGHLDTTYVQALKLLGLKDKIPADFREKYEAKQRRDILGIIRNLQNYTRRKERLEKEIKKDEKNEKAYSGGGLSGLSAEVSKIQRCFVKNPKLEEMQRGIAIELEKAIELEMHKTERQLSLARGITMNIPEYITALCKEYGVKIP